MFLSGVINYIRYSALCVEMASLKFKDLITYIVIEKELNIFINGMKELGDIIENYFQKTKNGIKKH